MNCKTTFSDGTQLLPVVHHHDHIMAVVNAANVLKAGDAVTAKLEFEDGTVRWLYLDGDDGDVLVDIS
jgi:hydrogenase maturation factor HypF (carbamoyltransferase family)